MKNEDLIIKPLLYNHNVLLTDPPIVYRHDVKGWRKYYSINKLLKYIEKSSVTTILDKVMPLPFWLEQWRASYGINKANEIMKQAGFYGTLLHTCLGDYLIAKKFDLSTIPARIRTYVYSNRISFDTWDWDDKLRHDILAFHHFVMHYNVNPLAVELVLISDDKGYGGAIDLVCEMTIGSGENGKILKTDIKFDKNGEIREDKTRRVIAIIDFKSGRHGFSESNEAQVHMYKNLFTEHYPHVPIEKVFNWAPKDWNKSDAPSYFLKDQTDSPEQFCIEHYVSIFNIKQLHLENNQYHHIDGTLEYGKNNLDTVLRVETFEQRAISKHKEDAGKSIKAPIVKYELKQEVLATEDVEDAYEKTTKKVRQPKQAEPELLKASEIPDPEWTEQDVLIPEEEVKTEIKAIESVVETIEIEEVSFENIANLFKD